MSQYVKDSTEASGVPVRVTDLDTVQRIGAMVANGTTIGV